MKKPSKTILFFGNERLATGVTTDTPVIRALLDSGYRVPAIVVAQDRTGPSRRARRLEIAAVAEQHRLPLLTPPDLGAARAQLAAFGADAGVLVAYGQLVPPAVLELFPRGIINLHPSLLPRHRGPTPIEHTILENEPDTGVSLMRLAAELDSGPLYAQTRRHLPVDRLTKQQLADELLQTGADLLIRHLPAILDGSLKPQPQAGTGASYDPRLQKQDGRVDWHKSAGQLEREVRAFAGWPRSQTTLGGQPVILTEVKALDARGPAGTAQTEAGRLIIFCKQGALEIERLIPAGKPEMTTAAFLAGHRTLE